MEKSEQINELAGALTKAQGMMKGAAKSADNPFFKSKYADLSSCWEAIREPFSANGLSIAQLTEQSPDMVVVETILMHSSGQWIGSKLSMKPVKTDPQSIGSCLTYARRYGLCAITGIAPEDDDGNHASGKASVTSINISPEQADEISKLIVSKNVDQTKFLSYLKCESLETIPAVDFNRAISALKMAKGNA
jgi:hypothetical protein